MKHALITAGHKGIGKKVTEQFLKKQYSVTVHFRSDKNKVRELQEEWHQYKDNVQFVEGDIRIKQILNMSLRRLWSNLDVLMF
ncbi:SDR family NAD(P)-dependent oxidoreductase [Priestia megaterium]|uniref:SDR family NAD(P)-dependent oxidoreductase n=1 Tax=Priestia megaterium TaxID=1404 RepID=UPI003CF6163A